MYTMVLKAGKEEQIEDAGHYLGASAIDCFISRAVFHQFSGKSEEGRVGIHTEGKQWPWKQEEPF